MDWDNIKKSDLLKLPKYEWMSTETYNSLLFIPTRKKHNSGYAIFVIIGIRENIMERVGFGDVMTLGGYGLKIDSIIGLQMDCGLNGVLRIFSNYFKFKLTHSMNTISFTLIERKD